MFYPNNPFISFNPIFFHWNHCKENLASSVTSCTAQIQSYFLFMSVIFLCLPTWKNARLSLFVINTRVLEEKALLS